MNCTEPDVYAIFSQKTSPECIFTALSLDAPSVYGFQLSQLFDAPDAFHGSQRQRQVVA